MIVPQPIAVRGSQKWLQEIVNNYPAIPDKAIESSSALTSLNIEWLSPLRPNGYAEYRDKSFLELLGLSRLNNDLKVFWPRFGPQWDALGKNRHSDAYFIVEAKANIPELFSDCGAKSIASLSLIDTSLSATMKWLDCEIAHDWKKDFYQYANRLAHLYFLREIGNVRAYLVFLYFVNDTTHIPTTVKEWKAALYSRNERMGLTGDFSSKGVAEVFIACNNVVKDS